VIAPTAKDGATGESAIPAIAWKGYISFGLVSFPVRLFAAARPVRIRFHRLHKKDLSRVKEVWYCVREDKPIERSDIVKEYETGKGEYVVVDDQDLKKIEPATANTMEIVQFVQDTEVDPIFLETSYYVEPGDDVSKPYELFLKALSETRYSAIAKISMHRREHMVLIRAAKGEMLLHTLFYPDELHAASKHTVPAKSNATRKEIDLAIKLIHQLAGKFNPGQFEDSYRRNVERLIEQKAKGRTIAAEPKAHRAPVVDLMEALQKSLKFSASSAKPAKPARSAKTKTLPRVA
jgi:DNA end-binding protein Ku